MEIEAEENAMKEFRIGLIHTFSEEQLKKHGIDLEAEKKQEEDDKKKLIKRKKEMEEK